MPFPAAAVLNGARDQHGALAPVNTPEPLAWRQLSRQQDALQDDMVTKLPGLVTAELLVPWPLTDFDAGIALATAIPTGWKQILRGYVRGSGTTSAGLAGWRPLQFLPFEQVRGDQGWRRQGFTLAGDTLRFLGVEADYNGVAEFKLVYQPIQPAITGGNSVINLPNDAQEVLELELAAFFLRRLVGLPAAQVDAGSVGAVAQAAADARRGFLERLYRTAGRQRYGVSDVTARP